MIESATTGAAAMNQDKHKARWWFGVTFAVAGLIAFMIGIERAWVLFDEVKTIEQMAQHGDFYGGILGAAANVAGTFLFFAALLLQSYEIALQREEFSKATDAYKDQKEQLESQAKELKKHTEELEKQTVINRNQALFSQIIELLPVKNDSLKAFEVEHSVKTLRETEAFLRTQIKTATLSNYQRKQGEEPRAHVSAIRTQISFLLTEMGSLLALHDTQRAFLNQCELDDESDEALHALVFNDDKYLEQIRKIRIDYLRLRHVADQKESELQNL